MKAMPMKAATRATPTIIQGLLDSEVGWASCWAKIRNGLWYDTAATPCPYDSDVVAVPKLNPRPCSRRSACLAQQLRFASCRSEEWQLGQSRVGITQGHCGRAICGQPPAARHRSLANEEQVKP